MVTAHREDGYRKGTDKWPSRSMRPCPFFICCGRGARHGKQRRQVEKGSADNKNVMRNLGKNTSCGETATRGILDVVDDAEPSGAGRRLLFTGGGHHNGRSNMSYRDETKVVQIGDRKIGGGNPILIQSMTNTKTEDVAGTVEQILRLERAGCEIIRCTVPTEEAAKAIKEIKKQIHIPLVADIHFDHKMAIAAMENGADKIRINPGNIGSRERVKAVVSVARERQIPIRVGVNSGSLEKPLLEKYGGVTPEGIVESALDKVHMIEDLGYDNLVISIKSSNVMACVKAHELLAGKTPYPLHVGITESGTVRSGNVKSALGLGMILSRGIGDTIRVSLTGDPVEEIYTAKLILRTLELRKGGIEVVSCPTCGRTQIDLIGLATKVEQLVADYPLDIKVAVMGCVVNGPGEAREADIGVAGGIKEGLLIRKGEILRKVPEAELLNALKEELDHWEA